MCSVVSGGGFAAVAVATTATSIWSVSVGPGATFIGGIGVCTAVLSIVGKGVGLVQLLLVVWVLNLRHFLLEVQV